MSVSIATNTAAVCALFALLMSPQLHATEEEVLEVLRSFIAAFENGDIEAMESSFAHDAVTFPRSIMAYEYDRDIDVSKYRRVEGIDPQMRELIDSFQKSGRERPYLDIEPKDLEIRVFGDAALPPFTWKATSASVGEHLSWRWSMAHGRSCTCTRQMCMVLAGNSSSKRKIVRFQLATDQPDSRHSWPMFLRKHS